MIKVVQNRVFGGWIKPVIVVIKKIKDGCKKCR
jgi:hypothetical protein